VNHSIAVQKVVSQELRSRQRGVLLYLYSFAWTTVHKARKRERLGCTQRRRKPL